MAETDDVYENENMAEIGDDKTAELDDNADNDENNVDNDDNNNDDDIVENKIRIYVKSLMGPKSVHVVDSQMTIAELKEIVADERGCMPKEIHLVFAGLFLGIFDN